MFDMETHCVQISAKVNIAWHTNSRYFPNHGVIQELKNHDAEISMSRDRTKFSTRENAIGPMHYSV
jgi:hypothetical protein